MKHGTWDLRSSQLKFINVNEMYQLSFCETQIGLIKHTLVPENFKNKEKQSTICTFKKGSDKVQ